MMPVMLDLSDQNILIVGGGKIANRYYKKLKDQGKSIEIVAPKIDSSFEHASIIEKEFDPSDLNDKGFVVAASNDAALNSQIVEMCKEKNILVVSATGVNTGNVSLGSTKSLGDLTIMVTTNGKSPSMGKALMNQFINQVPEDIEERLEILGEIRELLKKNNVNNRDQLLGEMINDSLEQLEKRRRKYAFESRD